MTKLEQILKYAELGWQVFPLQKKSKNPACKWTTESTNNRNQIIKWFRRYPDNNVAVDCGKSGIIVIDFDDYKGDIDFELSKTDLDTVQAITGRGGKHYYYKAPWGFAIQCSASKLVDNLDIRADGGYAVLPPSIHPETYQRYEWVKGHSPFEKELRPLPQVVLDKLNQHEKNKPTNGTAKTQLNKRALNTDKKLVLMALNSVDGDAITYDEWLNVYMAIASVFSKEETLQIMAQWARFNDVDRKKYDTFGYSAISIGTIFHYAKKYGGFDVGAERQKLKT